MKCFSWLVLGFAWVGFCPALLDCAGGEAGIEPLAREQPDTSFQSLVREFQADAQAVGRFYDLPWSATRFDRLERLYRDWQARLAVADFDHLDQQGRIDYLLLRGRLAVELEELSLERARLAEIEELIAWRLPIQALERSRWHMDPLKPQPAADAVARVAAQVKLLRQRLEKGKKDQKSGDKALADAGGALSTNAAAGAKPANDSAAASGR